MEGEGSGVGLVSPAGSFASGHRAGGYRAGMAGWLLQGVGSGSLGGWFSDLWDAGHIAGELELLALRTMGLVHPASSSHRLAPP